MAEEPMSAAAALLAVTEDERLIHPRDTKVDQFAQNIEDRVSNLVGGVSTWFSGINTQTQNAVLKAQDHVDKNGGVLSTARSHLARLESQFQSQSDRAREKSRAVVPDETLYELDTSNHEASLEEEPTSAAASANSSSSLPSTGVWDLLRKVTAHPHVERLQSAWTGANQDTRAQWNNTLKEAESLARTYVKSSGEAMQLAGRDLHSKLQSMIANVPSDVSVAEEAPGAKGSTRRGHMDDDEESFRWDDDDDDASQPTTSEPNKDNAPLTEAIKASNESQTDEADSDWE